MKATDLARYIIAYNDNVGDLITNKKLQKLLYYIAAWGVVYFDDGIIDDDFVAWIHGPVCTAAYNEYRHFGHSPLKIDYQGRSSSDYLKHFSMCHQDVARFEEKMELVNAVLQKYMPYSSLQLELLTHSEEPWREARNGLQPIEKGTNVISKTTMLGYYKSLIDGKN